MSVGRIVRNVVVVAWIGALASLGVRGLVREDARYAWGMFNYILHYNVGYGWRMQDGTLKPHRPGKELRRHKQRLTTLKWHKTLYGLGAVRDDVDAYARYAIAHSAPTGAVAFETQLRFKKHLGAQQIEQRSMRVDEVGAR